MLHILLTLNALLVISALLVRMSVRDNPSDPLFVLVWLLLYINQPQLLEIIAVILAIGLAVHEARNHGPLYNTFRRQFCTS
jgi:hypothetical protein